MQNIQLTIELSQEDRARLDAILAALTGRPDCSKCAEGVARYVNAMTCTPFPAPDPVEPVSMDTPEPEKPAEPATEAQAEPETPVVKLADVQRKVLDLSRSGKKAEARKIVTEYAERVSGIPEDKLPEVWQKLNALEG